MICSVSSGLEGGDESDGGVGSCEAWSEPESPTAIEPGDLATGIGSNFGRDEDNGGGGDALRERFALGPSYETSSSMSQSPCLAGGAAADDEAAADEAAAAEEADPVAKGLLPAADCVDQYGGTSS